MCFIFFLYSLLDSSFDSKCKEIVNFLSCSVQIFVISVIFAKNCGYDGPLFRRDDERRFLLRCELDAAYFHLYGIARDDVDYSMGTFPIVKCRDEKQ